MKNPNYNSPFEDFCAAVYDPIVWEVMEEETRECARRRIRKSLEKVLDGEAIAYFRYDSITNQYFVYNKDHIELARASTREIAKLIVDSLNRKGK